MSGYYDGISTVSAAELRHRISSPEAHAAHIKRIGNEVLSAWELERAIRVGRAHFDTLLKLMKLMPDVYRANGAKGVRARARFVELIVKADIEQEVRGYAFFDAFGVGDRQLDACFEQGDGREVCERLFRLALAGDARFEPFEPRALAPRGDQLALA